MKIIVPTDFSPLSVIAVEYAAELALKTDADLVLAHHVYLDVHGHAMVAMKSERILEAMVENAEEDLESLSGRLSAKYPGLRPIEQKIVQGDQLDEAVTSAADSIGANLIVIGTKGASGVKKVLIGSNAASVIRKSRIPVISVPEHARFRGVERLVYSSDLQDVINELSILAPLARIFNAAIHIMHVDTGGVMDNDAIRKVESGIRESEKYNSVILNVFRNVEIVSALEKYIDDVNADMLAMFTHKTTFFDHLFGRSVTREMAFHSHIPLLSIKK